MIKYFLNKIKSERGFTLVEIVVALAIFSIILLTLVSSFLAMNNSILKTKADMEVSDNAKRALDEIAYEIRSAKSIYTPTTTANQLSLETTRYLPAGENDTYIDFFICGSAICLKKESQNAIALTSDSVQVTSLTFSQISTGTISSVQVNLTVKYAKPDNNGNYPTISLTSTASLRGY